VPAAPPPRRPLPPLEQRVRDPGFTPSVRDLPQLVDLLADDALEKHAERAIARVGAPAVEALTARLDGAAPPLRARLVRALGRVAAALPDESGARRALFAALDDADPKARRNAAIALGHLPGEDVEDALLRAWERDARTEMHRSIAASLGKVGGARSAPRLREAGGSPDPELARIAQRAAMMVERTASRSERGRIDPGRTPAEPVDVLVLSRRGLEDLLAEELAAIVAVDEVRVIGPGRVRARLRGEMGALFGARTMLSFRFPLPAQWVRDGETPGDAIARAAASDAARAVLDTWTVGGVRYRIAWAGGGHRRAATWEAARAIAARAPALVNDPTASLWELVVGGERRSVEVALAPRALDDPRFAWRRGDVPAASHPTIAAALARVAGPRADDVVWDPFVGSGGELVERALLGPCRSLSGTDLDERALAVSRDNLGAAGVEARLERADALQHAPRDVTLVITNPPMGRRAARVSGLADMLDRFLAHAASVLVPRGRLVWIAPWPKRARAAGERAGLTLEWSRVVDMGGFDAEMQRWRRP